MTLSDSLVALGSLLGAIAFAWEMVRHMSGWIVKPSFHLSMKTIPQRDGSYNAHIYIENPKNKPLVRDATECRVRLRVLDLSGQELKGTTPLRWEQTGIDFNPRIPAGSPAFDLFALHHDPKTGKTYVNVCQGANSTLSRLQLPQDREPVNVEVTIESKERTIISYLRGVKLPELFLRGNWPAFEIDR